MEDEWVGVMLGETYLQVGQIDLFLSDVLTGEGSDEIVYFDSTHVFMGRWRCVRSYETSRRGVRKREHRLRRKGREVGG